MLSEETLKLIGEIHGTVNALKETTEEKLEKLEGEIKNVKAEISTIKTELSTYKTFLKFLRYLGLLIIAVFTFKFGDISKYWNGLFGN